MLSGCAPKLNVPPMVTFRQVAMSHNRARCRHLMTCSRRPSPPLLQNLIFSTHNGQIVKFYDAEPIGPGRYGPPRVTGVARTVITGSPDKRLISTSMIERQNLTMRMSMRRFTRLTNAFSKKLENLQAALALHFAHYNLVRVHKTLRITPAMAANVTDRLWSLEELVEQTSK